MVVEVDGNAELQGRELVADRDGASQRLGRASADRNRRKRSPLIPDRFSQISVASTAPKSPPSVVPMPRRKIQRAFLSWLEENRGRLALDIRLGRRTDEALEFSFAGITPAIEAR